MARMRKRLAVFLGMIAAAGATVVLVSSPAVAAPARATSLPAVVSPNLSPATASAAVTGDANAATVTVSPQAAGDYVIIRVYDRTFGTELGFVSLTTNSARTARELEICSYLGETEARINVADADGNATSQVIEYRESAGSGSCFTRTLGYPIRKFRAGWEDNPDNWSEWVSPPPL